MPNSEFANYMTDLLAGCLANTGELTSSRFFGGVGIKQVDVQFAMCMGNTLYFVVDDSTRQNYKDLGSESFAYNTKKGLRLVQRYYSVPEEVLEDEDLLRSWANEAIGIAMRTAKK